MFDVLIIDGGVAGVSCALVLGSAQNKAYAADKKIGIFTHQRSTNLQDALFNNAYGIPAGTLGSDLMVSSLAHLSESYPKVEQIEGEKVLKVQGQYPHFTVTTNKATYETAVIVVAIGASNTFMIDGLMEYIEPHGKAAPEKQRIQLRNTDQKVADGIYVAGTLAGKRSQLAIAAGSGAEVATDILTLWNDGKPSQSHDSIRK